MRLYILILKKSIKIIRKLLNISEIILDIGPTILKQKKLYFYQLEDQLLIKNL